MSEKKIPITVANTTLSGSTTGVHFIPSKFDTLIDQHGYNVYLDKALWCPCRVTELASSALSGCMNCGGTGYIFYNREKTKAILTSMGLVLPLKQWSQEVKGTVGITLREQDQVQEMDRVVVLDVVSIFSQRMQVSINEAGNELNVYTVYDIVTPLDLFLFINEKTKLQRLQLNSDYIYCDNRITLDKKFLNKKPENLSVSLRYKHHPQFHVLDINREVISAPVVFDGPGNTSTGKTKLKPTPLPIHAIGRRAHYIFDLENRQQNRILDNSYLGLPQDCGCGKMNPLNITQPNSITIYIKDNPSNAKLKLFNGQEINLEYKSGPTFKIPHLEGLLVNKPIFMDGKVFQSTIKYNPKTTEFDYSAHGGFHEPNVITIRYNEKSEVVKIECTIEIEIANTPDSSLTTLCTGEQIAKQYSPGNLITISALIGKRVLLPIYIDNKANQKITFNPVNGQLNGTIRGGFRTPEKLTINYVENAV